MAEIPEEIVDEIVLAMDSFKIIAQQLIDKLILETNQPEKAEIAQGYYSSIQSADLLNGQEYLSDNWWFEVHGEHCLFENIITGQTLEVSLFDKESIGNLDPYFFYNFLKTTERFNHLTEYFNHGFTDMLNLFVELEKQGILARVDRIQFRKI